MFGSLVKLSLLLSLAAVPPLAELQRMQLESAEDYTAAWDQGALYPLMQNALTWETNDEAGAMIPDYEALSADPAAYRGTLFVIEGQLGGPPEQLSKPMARPGPWDNRIQRWSVLYQTDPDKVAVVYLVDPPPLEKTPRSSIRVRLLCRFYKVWRFKDINDHPTDYLVFVGKTTREAAPSQTRRRYTPQTVPIKQMLIMLLVGAGVLIFIFRRASKMSFRPKPLSGQLKRQQAQAAAGEDSKIVEVDPDLPEDPEQALRVMASPNETENDESQEQENAQR